MTFTKGGSGRPSAFVAAACLAAFALVPGCAASGPGRAATAPASAPAPSPTPAPEPDGSSRERAIPILEGTESAGIAAERAWLAEHYPGARRVRGYVSALDGRHYDEIVLRLPDGTEKTLYFDITAFYGF